MMKRICQALLFTLKDQRGVTKVLVALSAVVLLGFTALVVDVGAMYFEKSRLQKALDAAVLGGAQHLVVTQEKAGETAKDIAFKNGFSIADEELKTEAEAIEIEKTVKKELTFARIFGINDADIYAIARAELVQALVSRDGIVPVGLERDKYEFDQGKEYSLNLDNANKKNGNHGFLSLDGRGESSWENAVKNGSKSVFSVGDRIYPEPGNLGKNVIEAFQYRIDLDKNDPGKFHCSDYQTADNSCRRVIIVPLVTEFPNGRSEKVEILDFAAFWIKGFEGKNTVIGVFIDYATSGTFEERDTDSNIYGVKLVK